MLTLETLALIACIGATSYLTYKAGYAEAKRKYEQPDALESYYNGYNYGYTSGYSAKARESFKRKEVTEHGSN